MDGGPLLRELGRLLLIAGVLLVVVGSILLLTGGRIPGLGRLPGDLVFQRGRMTVFIPLTTCVLLSLLLTLLFNLFFRR